MSEGLNRRALVFLVGVLLVIFSGLSEAAPRQETEGRPALSPESEACMDCHTSVTPGLVHDWLSSRHARVTPGEALKKPPLERRVSVRTVPETLAGSAVGCFECHGRNPATHKDSFEHFGFTVHAVVSPEDCRTCHPDEADQYSGSKKAHAIKNLMSNPVGHTLVSTVTGLKKIENGKIVTEKPSEETLGETCLGCHGTKVEVKGTKTVSSKIGDVTVANLTNWPNQGVGRENPDGSIGSCSACHPRHGFSIEVARKPDTCSQCHLDPDVPAWNVYKESKHGNIYSSKYHSWEFDAVPWKVGKDFKSPTCASCHNSLVVSPDGEVVAERTHDFGARLWVRLFGLIYSHAQPKSGNTTGIRNKDGLPLPTAFTGEPASEFLIDKTEQDRRLAGMKGICMSCHATNWVSGHFKKLDSTLKETDRMTLAATALMQEAWDKKAADSANPFDELIEQMWARQWLFYSNSIRYASAMTGAPDYAAFKNGWWELTANLSHMRTMIDLLTAKQAK